jgi:microcystin-dependent protein
MSDPFVAEIRMFGFNFAPTGWAQCNGQLLPLSQNTALFSLLGTFYGGDGKSTFALPNLQGSAAVHQGQGPGLSERFLGEQGGSETVTLLTSEMPLHNHSVAVNNSAFLGQLFGPAPTANMARAVNGLPYTEKTTNLVNMAPESLAINGSSFPHNNMMPFLAVEFCIAMQGVFPPRQ